MNDFIRELVTEIMDAIEEFFEAMVAPTVKFTRDAFLVSLVFLAWSIVATVLSLPSCVSWQEALTCSIMMVTLVLIDSSSRSAIKDNLNKIKQYAYSRTQALEEGDNEDDEQQLEQ